MFVPTISSEPQNIFFNKLGVVMQNPEQEYHAEKILQGEGHSEGSCDQNMTFSSISSKLLILWQLNLV